MNNTAFNKDLYPNIIGFRGKKKDEIIKPRNRIRTIHYVNYNQSDIGYNSIKNKKNKGDSMDNDKILEMYISKVDKDQAELKQDMRERDARLENHIITSEKRVDEKLSKIESMIMAQNNQIEKINDKIDKVKDDIHKNTIEQYRFWIGLAVSIVIGIAGIIVTLIK